MPIDSIDVELVDPDALMDVVAEHGPFLLLPTRAVPTRDATYEEWEAAANWVQAVEKASPWWVADLLAYGEQRFGDMYTQAMTESHLAYQTLANMKNVARSVAPSRRREGLSFAHHQEVAPLLPAEQIEWLARAEAEGFTVTQLRLRIKADKAATAGLQVEFWVTVKCKSEEDQQALAARFEAEGRSVKLASTQT